MDSVNYPTSPAQIDKWCRQFGLKPHEGKARFAEFCILEAIASNAILRSGIVLKGGNALRFFYQSPRSTLDLDFTARANVPDDQDELRRRIDHALQQTARQFNVKTRCQRIKRNPPNKNRTWPTYEITIGYQFPSDPYFQNFDDRIITTVVHMEISFNDVVCETNGLAVEPNSAGKLQVCTLEDIIAEKLRSLLQQPHRRRNRSQDVFDICKCLRIFGPQLDRRKIHDYLITKSTARGIEVRRTCFDDIVREMASVDYDKKIRPQTGAHFIEFVEAYAETMALVESLNLPP